MLEQFRSQNLFSKTIMDKIFEKNTNFHAKKRTTGKF